MLKAPTTAHFRFSLNANSLKVNFGFALTNVGKLHDFFSLGSKEVCPESLSDNPDSGLVLSVSDCDSTPLDNWSEFLSEFLSEFFCPKLSR